MYEMNSKETDLFKNVEHMKAKNTSTKMTMTNVTTLISYQILKYVFWNSSISYYEAYSNPTAKYVQVNYKEG